MSKPRLPSRASDVWEGGFVLDPVRAMRSVNARGGLVVAGGAEICLLRPGDQRMRTRPPPLDIGPIRVAAAEPRGARRYAVVSDEMIAIFYRTKQGDQLLRLRPTPPGPVATHLAWGAAETGTTLYIRRDDGAVLRLNHDLTDVEEMDVEPMDALAADDNGVVGMVALDDEEPRAYVLKDGVHMHFRACHPLDSSEHVYLAVADMAVALSVPGEGTYLSRGQDDEFVQCRPLAQGGPLEFEGPSSDAALFGAYPLPDTGVIERVDVSGEVIRLAEYGTEGGDPVEVTALAWDSTRRTLWGASPQAGLFTSAAPGPRQGKKVVLS